MYILSGAFVKAISKILLDSQDLKMVYPIELQIGGKIGGIVLNFETREVQDEWICELQKATGNLNIL